MTLVERDEQDNVGSHALLGSTQFSANLHSVAMKMLVYLSTSRFLAWSRITSGNSF